MRVLWFSATPALYDEKKNGGWIASLEYLIRSYAEQNIELGIAFEYNEKQFKIYSGDVVYYPIDVNFSRKNKLRISINPQNRWLQLRSCCEKIIADFKPDIIHCFGTEFSFANVSECTEVPVVVHMQGFLNSINYEIEVVIGLFEFLKIHRFSPWSILKYLKDKRMRSILNEEELSIMKKNRFFMGRTDWDKNIVKYMSPFAKYFFCPEAIRSEIYESSRHWTFERSDTMSIITITTANEIKGNGLILQTALFLKRVMHFNFIWSIAGSVQSFKSFEKLLGIKHEDVNIKLLGMIDAKSVAKELVVSEVYVHPSIIDNSPNSLCEAQLIGCPVVSSYVGGIPSLVKNGETGFFFPYNEPQSLAFLLMNLHNDKDLLEKISREEIEVSRERHNPSLVVNRLLSIYNDIIEKKFN